jgi:hypothetical protein
MFPVNVSGKSESVKDPLCRPVTLTQNKMAKAGFCVNNERKTDGKTWRIETSQRHLRKNVFDAVLCNDH